MDLEVSLTMETDAYPAVGPLTYHHGEDHEHIHGHGDGDEVG